MQSLALRLMAILAYLLMPFTMGSAMAAPVAAPAHHESMMAMDGMGHCPDEGPARPDNLAFVGCAMMCAALPAADLARTRTAHVGRGPAGHLAGPQLHRDPSRNRDASTPNRLKFQPNGFSGDRP